MYEMQRAKTMSDDMKICVLLTSVGGLVAPGIIENLRRIPEVSRIVGIDAANDAIGFYMVDKSYSVPKGNDPKYIDALLEVVEKECVDLIIPASDEEVLTLSVHKEFLRDKGVAVLCSPPDVTSTAIDKGSMLTFLKKRGVCVPRFYLPETKKDLVKASEELGYPEKPVVVKPRKGRGGRGFRILKEQIDVLHTRDSSEMKLKWLLEVISELEIKELLVMEYLAGDDYSVDVLADNGSTLFVVPRKRIRAILGPSQLGEVVWNQEVVDVVELIVKKFQFNSIINVQLKYSGAPEEGPMVYEINPRVSGTIVMGNAAGVDLLYYGIRHALGMDLPTGIVPRPVKMIRYLKEYFVNLTGS